MNKRHWKGSVWLGGMGTALLVVGWLAGPLTSAVAAELVVYKSAACGCCTAWVRHMEQNGFTVQTRNVANLAAEKGRLRIPPAVESCHTGVIGEYRVEGHVPAADVRRLLLEKPSVLGIATPGMPVGSPGMTIPGQKPEPYQVVTFTADGQTRVFASH